MKRSWLSPILLLSLMMAFAWPLPASHVRAWEQQSVRVGGAVEKPGEWTAARMAQEFAGDIQTVSYTLKGKQGKARCLPLLTLIHAAQPRVDEKRKNPLLAFAVVVKGRDGYAACISLGELLPEFGNHPVWLALDRDGQPLSGPDAPVGLLVPDDKKPSRWVHGIATITLLNTASAESTPE